MLRGLAPILSGPLLTALDSLGHGDKLAVVDANFPLGACPTNWVTASVCDEGELLDALLRHLPLEGEATVMEHPEEVHSGVVELTDVVGLPVGSLSRGDYYTAARAATLVIRTRDQRPYGNVLLTVGALAAETDGA